MKDMKASKMFKAKGSIGKTQPAIKTKKAILKQYLYN